MSDGYTFWGQPTGTTSGTVAAGNHTHAGSAIDSGTVAYARLPTGTAASTVAIGDHTHYEPARPSDRGLIAWNMPISVAANSTVVSPAGTLFLMKIRRVPAGNITNVCLLMSVVGSTLTTGQCFAALYTSAGVLVGQTADQAANWSATAALKTMALVGGPYPVAAGDYYVGWWYNGTTGPQFLRGLSSALYNSGTTAPTLETATANTGLTTTAPNPFGTQTSQNNAWFAAVS